MMNFEELYDVANRRRTAKQYNHEKDIDREVLTKIYEFVKTAPHSMGQEYVRVINIGRTSKHKIPIVGTMKGFNQEKSMMASDVAIIVTKTQEFFKEDNPEIIEAASRVVRKSVEAKGIEFKPEMAKELVSSVVNDDHGNNGNNTEEWSARQGYILLGYFLIAAETLGVNTTCIEGFTVELTEYLRSNNLIKQDERATLAVCLGYVEGMDRAFIGKGQLRKSLKEFVDFQD